MKTPAATHTRENLLLGVVLALVVFGAFFRLFRVEFFPSLPNFAPIMAIAFCGALFLPGWLALVAPLGALVLSDILLNLHYGASFQALDLLRYACFGVGVATGLLSRRFRGAPAPILGVVTANSLLFYLVTNTVAWATDPGYTKTATAWLQSLTVGLHGLPPTWMFFGYSLASDLLFTGIFLGAWHLATRKSEAAVPAHA